MWKVLLVISSVVLAGGAYLSYSNMGMVKEKKDEVAAQKATLEQREASLEEATTQIAALKQSIQTLDDEAESLNTEKIDLDAKVVESQSNLKALEANLASAKESLESARELAGNIQKVQALQKEMIQIRTQIEEAEIEATQLEGAVVAAQVEADRLQKVAAELQALRQDQEAGIIRGDFQSQIKKAYNQWGFVIVDGGNDQGVVDNAQLNVYRRGMPICKLLVTSVEPTETVADIIPGSLAAGQTVQIGDTVVKTVRASAPAVPASTGSAAPAPSGDQSAPATQPEAAPAMNGGGAEPDPFGGGGAMTPAPESGSEPDPFGGGGDAMTPAPESGAAPDPFGGSSEPAPAESTPDPFGN